MILARSHAQKLRVTPNVFTEGSFTYTGRDGNTGLFGKYCHLSGSNNAPIAAICHGYDEDANAIQQTTMRRFAGYGFCAVSLGMRGRNGATGARDASGRELGDIADGIAALRTLLGSVASANHAVCVGYSGGGGNTIGMLAKYPDLFCFYVDHFGITDYGNLPGWWGQDGSNGTNFRTIIESSIGGTPAALPNDFAARAHQEPALRNLAKAPRSVGLAIIHHPSDNAVRVWHSDELYRRAVELGLGSRVTYTRGYAAAGDPHGYPETVPALAELELTWKDRALLARPWSMPTKGNGIVAGLLETKTFGIYIADAGAPNPKTVAYHRGRAHVVWDEDNFLITPHTGNVTVRVERGGKVATSTFSTPTLLVAT